MFWPHEWNELKQETEKGIRIKIWREEIYGMTQNKMVYTGNGRQQEGNS
jgi:hypothetical protein